MKLKSIFWLAVCAALMLFIYNQTGAVSVFQVKLEFFVVSFAAFLTSMVFWNLAWIYLLGENFKTTFRIGIKSLLGVFSPLGLGGDALRAYYAGQEGISADKALAASFVTKFFKFLLMFVFLVIAIALLALSTDVSEYAAMLASMLVLTLFGAIFVFAFKFRKAIRFFHRIFRRVFVLKMGDQIQQQFSELSRVKIRTVLVLLLISSLLEIVAVAAAFQSAGIELSLAHYFIFSAIAHSLALVTVTPQGAGFVEGGGFFVLSLPYFGLEKQVIGSFLILWSVIRIWLPSLAGLVISLLDRPEGLRRK